MRAVKTNFSTAPLLRRTLAMALPCLALGFLAMPAAAADTKPVAGLQLIAEGFTSPLDLLSLPDGSGRLLISDQIGVVKVLNKDGSLSDQAFLDLREKMIKLNAGFDERGLLGLAPHPKFKANHKLYVFYSAARRASAPTNFNCVSRLSEFKVAPDNLAKVDLASERVLLEIDKPQMNHNGGRLVFGPDGFLYIGVGDGGGANDNELGHAPQGNGQDTTTLLGKILRLDVDKGAPYAVPRDNPFADGTKGRKEIFAYGLRNPWGISFDRGGKHEFFAVDVGQNLFEELNIIVNGGNYGWRVREGFHGFDPKNANRSDTNAQTKDIHGRAFIDPVLEYKHPGKGKLDPTVLQGISVTGGYVYRGRAIPALQGRYVFGDWSRNWALPDGVLFTALRDGTGAKANWKLEFLPLDESVKLGGYIVGFGEDADGEIYVLTNGRNSLTGTTGKVFKLVAK